MTTLEILKILPQEIHASVFATVDEKGLQQTCGNCFQICPVKAVERSPI